ncbi:hypothetical protein A3K48_04935 [candidate division WOR-1 bacterium RIFOXYA12_FULL_52_29]|uniref:Translocation/assembly module TamB n=1 Tax=candidate division WOR-1 bacterium RIFOXYC12_FULL_54_18 TaxID=1802584 RepID=A0A1F4T709_UNCSA|nr:MAG: hypothetical protein A3K44_04935 [candidate division WOR-1 bacterium RIFOXYA2_FULL_51_19]OGC17892.1 MAG: hypothetical protein A3K48_04935 [candidate division WOR-1 bacterium RIFOXYA12_FULL_52_29]OGC26748.1 MAG: hypothetical protein A3K32_04930 [candidate division WOR-1 bacterium RIFOXYB2_FULL_45_9]OGC28309.1 MAG: hypothetical protein A3K49_04935 [candidate division WOR-1 bacterium RIFOXYC12_FULL_54_18]OGC31235.1 MAG: hypothetical protein A2346_07685 [candidate division WOR-1 bacterium R
MSIRDQAEKGFADLFKTKVSIKEAGGSLIGQIVLKGVSIKDIGEIDEVVLHFNPIKFAINKGDIIPSLTKLSFINGKISVARDLKGKWNIDPLLPKPNDKAAPPPPFSGQIVLENCEIAYIDLVGFMGEPTNFQAIAKGVNGEVDLRNIERITFSAAGAVPEKVKAAGLVNSKTGRYELTVTAEQLPFSKWGVYTIPLPGLSPEQGKVDLSLKLTPPKTKGWPVSLSGKATFHDAAARYGNYDLTSIRGNIFIADESLAFQGISGQLNDLPVSLNGRLTGFQSLDLTIGIKQGEINKLAAILPFLKTVPVGGLFSANLRVGGTIGAPTLSGSTSVINGKAYGQAFSGGGDLSFGGKTFRADLRDVVFYGGTLSGPVTINLTGVPQLDLMLNISGLNLATLSQNTPGITGLAGGDLAITGPFSQLKGKLNGRLNRTAVFGQPLNSLRAAFQIKEGEFFLDNLIGESEQAGISAKGRISRDLTFDLLTEASGLKLAGRGIFGPMRASLNRFNGRVSWKLTPAFLSSPLRNMEADGEVSLSDGEIGEQQFDRADGTIEIDHGKIDVKNASLIKGGSKLFIAGQTGIGTETSLVFWTNGSRLEDYKILNYFLPDDLKYPSGNISASFEATGYLPPETRLTEIDQLLDLNINGRIALADGRIGGVKLTSALAGIGWRERALFIEEARLTGPLLRLTADLMISKRSLSGEIQGAADLFSLEEFTYRYGRFSGEIGATIKLSGTPSSPAIAATFRAEELKINDLYFDEAAGSVYWANKQIMTLTPLLFRDEETSLYLNGRAIIDEHSLENSFLDLELKTDGADMAAIYQLLQGIRGEAYRWGITSPNKIAPQKLSLANLSYSAQRAEDGKTVWYDADPRAPNFVRDWGALRAEFEKKEAGIPSENLKGELKALLKFKGKISSPAGSLRAEIKKGGAGAFRYDSLVFSASLADRKVSIEKAVLSKERGELTATGGTDLSGNLDLKIKAKEMPLDICVIFFPGKEFKGTFNLNAALSGPYYAPYFSLSANGRNNLVAGANFSSWSTDIDYQKERLTVHRSLIKTGNDLSTIEGTVIFSGPAMIDLKAQINNGGFGLLNLWNDEVSWVKGEASLSLRAEGSLDTPTINGQIKLNNAEVKLRSLASSLRDIDGTGQIKASLLNIEGLTAIWTGERTRYFSNLLGLSGYIDLKRALVANPEIDLNLAVSPTRIYAAFPNIFVGSLKTGQLSIIGPLRLDQTLGPTLRGAIEIENSVITLSKSSGQPGKGIPFQFELEVDLNKNVYAVMGDIGTLDLSNIFMNLEIESQKLQITGDMRTPTLLGRVRVKRGTVNLLSREFTILTADQQQRYFPYSSEQISDNTAIFTGEKGTEGYLPQIRITSLVNVDDQERDAEGKLYKKRVIIVAKLTGLIGAREEARGLRINLTSFVEDKTKSPPEMRPASYSESDLKVLLLPEFIKGLTGIKTGTKGTDGSQVDTNLVVADFVSSRIQTILFRGLEREVEQKLGLESLTLEYNLGPKVREAMGLREINSMQEDRPAWSVGFVKGFFDRLYIDIRYSQAGEQTVATAAQNAFNYQLTFKITPIWSIIYYREPINLNEPATGYQKVTLKAGFYLW